jgi:hypothetical protein
VTSAPRGKLAGTYVAVEHPLIGMIAADQMLANETDPARRASLERMRSTSGAFLALGAVGFVVFGIIALAMLASMGSSPGIGPSLNGGPGGSNLPAGLTISTSAVTGLRCGAAATLVRCTLRVSRPGSGRATLRIGHWHRSIAVTQTAAGSSSIVFRAAGHCGHARVAVEVSDQNGTSTDTSNRFLIP